MTTKQEEIRVFEMFDPSTPPTPSRDVAVARMAIAHISADVCDSHGVWISLLSGNGFYVEGDFTEVLNWWRTGDLYLPDPTAQYADGVQPVDEYGVRLDDDPTNPDHSSVLA